MSESYYRDIPTNEARQQAFKFLKETQALQQAAFLDGVTWAHPERMIANPELAAQNRFPDPPEPPKIYRPREIEVDGYTYYLEGDCLWAYGPFESRADARIVLGSSVVAVLLRLIAHPTELAP